MRNLDNYCDLVDVFCGNGEVDHFPEDGLASKWFYIKAISGNTVPHAVLPFGKMSVGPYSGGYPCGYGTHYPNCCGGIEKLSDNQKARGFSHIHHSGVGGICYYFNYAVTTPFYGGTDTIKEFYELKNEKARPGYYSAELNGIFCEFTVFDSVAVHRYRFAESNGRIAVDFSNDGLSRAFREWYRGKVTDTEIRTDKGRIYFSGVFSGIRLYFCAETADADGGALIFDGGEILSESCLSKQSLDDIFGAVFNITGKEAEIRVSSINPDHVGVTYLPVWKEGDKNVQTGIYRGWGLIKGAKNPVAAGIFLREYLDINNYDVSNAFLTDELSNFFFQVTGVSSDIFYYYGNSMVKSTGLGTEFADRWSTISPDQIRTYIEGQLNVMNEMSAKANEIIQTEKEWLKEEY